MPRKHGLSIDLLRTVIALYRGGGDAVRAAGELAINLPSMSKRLRVLQQTGRLLRCPWVRRQGKRWRLTVEGRRVLPAIEEIVTRYDRLVQFLAEERGPSVYLACGQQAAAHFVREAVLAYRKAYPDVRLRLSTQRGASRIEGVANGSLDLATVTHDEAQICEIGGRRLHLEPLREDPLLLVCARTSPFHEQVARLPGPAVPPEALIGLPLVLPDREAGIRHALDAAFRHAGVIQDLDVVLETGGWATSLSYVRDGLAAGVLSGAAARWDDTLTIRPLDPVTFPPRVTTLICRRLPGSPSTLDLSPEGMAFRETLIRAARRAPS